MERFDGQQQQDEERRRQEDEAWEYAKYLDRLLEQHRQWVAEFKSQERKHG